MCFEEKAYSAGCGQPEFKAALSHMRKGDTSIIWKLDRLVQSMMSVLAMMRLRLFIGRQQ